MKTLLIILVLLITPAHSQDLAASLRSQARGLNDRALTMEQAARAELFSRNVQYGTVPESFGEYHHFIPMHWCCYDVDLMRELNRAGSRNASVVYIDIEACLSADNETDAKYNISSKWWKENTGSYPPKWHTMNDIQKKLKFLYDLDWMCRTVYDVRYRLLKDSNLRYDTKIGVFLGHYYVPADCVRYFSERNPGSSAPASGITKGQYPPLLSMLDCIAVDYYKPPDIGVESWLGPYYVPQALGRFKDLPIKKYAWLRCEADATDKTMPSQYHTAKNLRRAMVISKEQGYDGFTLVEFQGAKWDDTDWLRAWGTDNPYPGQEVVDEAVTEYIRSGK